MKIDFQHFRLKVGIAGCSYAKKDVREGFANVIYSHVPGIAALELSRKVYSSEGETEFNDKEMRLLETVVNELTTPSFIESFRKVLDEQKQ